MQEKWCAIYLSGTGNTEYCVRKLTHSLDGTAPIVAIEDERAATILNDYEFIILGYPVQFSNAPKLVRDFICQNAAIWKGKRVVCVATMGAFSGDGAGCTARLLKKCGASVLGGLHLKMPDSVCDSKLLKKNTEAKLKIVERAEAKIQQTADNIRKGNFPRDGLNFFCRLAGLFGQRLWFYGKTRRYSDKLNIDPALCIGCGTCTGLCPMNNLSVQQKKAAAKGYCTMCYRCISKCPQKAITLIGKNVVEQYRLENYIT